MHGAGADQTSRRAIMLRILLLGVGRQASRRAEALQTLFHTDQTRLGHQPRQLQPVAHHIAHHRLPRIATSTGAQAVANMTH